MLTVRGKKIPLIEAHCHVWEEFHGQRGGSTPLEMVGGGRVRENGVESQFLPPSYTDYSVKLEVLEGYMHWLGIDKALILQNPCYGDQREYVRDIVRNGAGKYKTFGMLDPREIDSLSTEMDLLLDEYECSGFKIEVPDVPFIMDAPEYDFMWRKIYERDVTIAIDLGFGSGPYDFNLERLRNVVKRYPNMKLMLPHMGISRLWDKEQKYPFPHLIETLSLLEINKDNLYFDIAALPSIDDRTGGDYPYYYAQEIMRSIKSYCGMDRIMWGSDFPGILRRCTYKQSLEFVTRHCTFLTDDELTRLLGENALKFLFNE